VGAPGLGTTQAERRREELNVNALCGSISGGKEEGASEEDEVNDIGNPATMQGLVPMTSAIVRQEGSEEGGSQEGVTPDVMMAQMVGEEEAIAGSRSITPPRRRKSKGLFELGDSVSYPRQSVRLISRLSQVGASSHARDGMSSDPLSDGDVINFNLRLCEPSISVEPSKLWEIGLQAGLRCQGDKEEVVKEYHCLEKRDSKFMKKYEKGKKDGHLC